MSGSLLKLCIEDELIQRKKANQESIAVQDLQQEMGGTFQAISTADFEWIVQDVCKDLHIRFTPSISTAGGVSVRAYVHF